MMSFKDIVRQRALVSKGLSSEKALVRIQEDARKEALEQEKIQQAVYAHEHKIAWEKEQLRQAEYAHEQQMAWEQEQIQQAQRLAWEEDQKVKWEQEQRATWIYNQARTNADKIVNDASILAKRIVDESQLKADKIYRKNEDDIIVLNEATVASQKALDDILIEYMAVRSQVESLKKEIKNTNRVVFNPEDDE